MQAEVADMRNFVMGKGGRYPQKGALDKLQEGQDRAEVQRLKDKTEYHRRFDELPDLIITKLNGTYVKTDDLPFAVETALAARRRKRWGRVGRFFGNEAVKLLGGAAIIIIAALILGHVTGHL